MYVTTKTVTLNLDIRNITGKIKTPENMTLGYVFYETWTTSQQEPTEGITATIKYDKNRQCSTAHYAEMPNFYIMPVFNENKDIDINIEAETGSTIVNITLTFIFYNKKEIDFKAMHDLYLRQAIQEQIPETTIGYHEAIIYKNRTDKPVYVEWIEGNFISPAVTEISINDTKIFNNNNINSSGSFFQFFVHTQAWIPANGKLWYKIYSDGSGYFGNYRIKAVLSDKEYKKAAFPYILGSVPENQFKLPELPTLNARLKTTALEKPQYMNDEVPPYLIPPGTEFEFIPTIPKPVNINVTSRYRTPDSVSPKRINTKEEQRTVESIASPFGAVRRSADAGGRVRSTIGGINYNAGTLNVTDTSEHQITMPFVFEKLHLEATSGDWQIKILTLYGWLAGKAYNDTDIIKLSEGETLDINMEGKQVWAACTNASTSTPGNLDYLVEW